MAKHPPTSHNTNPDDYQKVPRPIAAMSKTFKDGIEIAPQAAQVSRMLEGAAE